MATSKINKIKEQIEYYLGDENLQNDEFFRKEIESGSDGYVNLNVFQKCNKIKKLGVTNEEILNAIKSSEKIEVNPANNSLRRKNNKPLPEFKNSNKKIKTENNGNKKNEEEIKEELEKEEEDTKYEPMVFSITAENDDMIDWKKIQGEIEKAFGTKVYYTRYNKNEKGGHLILNKHKTNEAKQHEIEEKGITIDNVPLKIKLIKEKDLENFWKEHGGHYTLCTERNEKKDKKKKKDKKSQKNERKEREKQAKMEISLANRKYADPSKVKNIFKQMLATTQNGDVIPEPGNTMLKDILKFHESGEKKLENMKHFTVGIHPDYKSTRCFFVVKEDGSQEDFSIQKCLERVFHSKSDK